MPQHDRIGVHLESADFPTEHVWVARLVGDEAISQLFRFELDVLVTEPDTVDPDSLLGAEVDIVFERADVEVRRQHAVIAEVRDGLDSVAGNRAYHLVLYPRAFRLAMIETQAIFIDLSVPEIIRQKLKLVGLGDDEVRTSLVVEYPKRELVVQYRETDLAFVSRLAEHLGMSFYVEQHEGKDRLVFTDDPSGFAPLERSDPIGWTAGGERTGIYAFEGTRKLMPGMWAMQDYNYMQPLLDITGSHEAAAGAAGGVLEYGAHYFTPKEGEALARVRAEEREALARYYTGASDMPELSAGHFFPLSGHPMLDEGQKLLCVSVHHEMRQRREGASPAPGNLADEPYRNTFRVVDASKSYRPPRVTPKPKIHGVATAFIEPNADSSMGKVAAMDAQGRYTVKIHFDPAPVGERMFNSHRVRLIQNHSGPNYGTHLPLKAGTEVLLVFVDGDPDRPLIVGATHNPVTPAPVTARNPTMHRIKTASGILIEMKDDFEA